MKKVKALLLTLAPFCVSAQQKTSLSLDVYAKKSLMYANQDKVNTANDYHFSSPVTWGANLLVNLPVNSRVQFQTGLGYSPARYALKLSVDSNWLDYKYTAGVKTGAVKLLTRMQYTLKSKFSITAGVTFNYNRNWSVYTSKTHSPHETFSRDQYLIPYVDEDFITFSMELGAKYRLTEWLESYVMLNYDWGKYTSVYTMSEIWDGNREQLYVGSMSPKLFGVSFGFTMRLKEYTKDGKSKKEYVPSEKGVNVDILNGVLPQ